MKRLLLAACLLPAAAWGYENVSLQQAAPFEKQIKEPGGVVVSKSGKVYVSDAGSDRVAVLSKEGKWEGGWGAKGKEPGQLNEPRGLAEDAEGNVYVADSGNSRVEVFSADGKFVRAIGTKGSGAGQLAEPSAVAVSRDGFVFVSDTGNGRIQVFTTDGLYIQGFGVAGQEKGQLKEPGDIGLTPDGNLWVLDRGNNRVQRFSSGGRFLGVLAGPGATGKEPESLREPASLVVDAYGFVYVGDSQQNKVKEFSPDGEFTGSFGTWGAGPGQFKKISALAASPDGDVTVADAANRRLQSFHLESAAKEAKPFPVPAFRFQVKALPPVNLDVDDLAFSGGSLVGVAARTNQLVVAADYGQGAAKTFGGGKAKGAESLSGPTGVTVKGEALYVTDAGNRRVAIWNAEGKPVGPGEIGGAGKREGQFKSPHASAVDPQGRIHVIDSALARGQTFSRDGIFLLSFGSEGPGPGQFTRPVDIVSLGDQVAVLDAERRALIFFDTKGRFLSEATGFVGPVAVAVDPDGRSPFYYVLDAGAGQVRVVKDNGQTVGAFGSPALFQAPKSLALDDRGRLWIADGATVKPFAVSLLPAAPAALRATADEGQIELRWTADAEKLAAAYAIYRSTVVGASGDLFKTIASTAVPFVDAEIVPGLTYYYQVAGRASADANALEGPRASVKMNTVRPANLPALDITSLELNNIFSAQYKYYVSHPIGHFTVKNNMEKTFQKLRVGFVVQDFMDYPSETLVERLNPGGQAVIDMKGVFNNKILSVNEDTPIQAQITVTYYEDGVEKVFKRSQPFTLYSRNAMAWDDPRRIATFVTPKDPPVLEFARTVVKSFNEEIENSPVDKSVSAAQALFEALGAHGLTYQKDPNNPFEKAVENTRAVDYVQYPRETLKRKTGDCDDLVNLYASALESVTVPTALLDVPGHILLMFQADAEDAELGMPADLVVDYKDAQWIPVEVTMVGKPFEDAWREGAKEYRAADADKKATVIDVHEAWQTYQPGTLPEEPAIVPPTKEEIAAKFPDAAGRLSSVRLESMAKELKAKLESDPKNEDLQLQLGFLYADHGKYEESAAWFDKLAAANPQSAAAVAGRGNVCLLQGDAAKAAELYRKAIGLDPKDGGLSLNLARAAWTAGDKDEAEKSFRQALELRPELSKDFKTLDEFVKK